MADTSPFALRLSHAHAWAKCPAFVHMNRTQHAATIEAEQDTTVREEGTAMHWAAEQMLRGGQLDAVSEGDVAPNGVELTDELIDGAAFYTSYLWETNGVTWSIETQLAAPSIHAQCGGTPDAFAFRAASSPVILLSDLKGGFRNVEVFPNPQLFGYTAAIVDNYPHMNRPDTVVEYAIIQPRSFHVDGPIRKHTMLLRDVMPHIAELRDAAQRATGEHAQAMAGPQCDDCAGRVSCSVAHAAGMRALEVAGEPDVQDLPTAAIDYEMLRIEEAQRMLTARLTGLQALAAKRMRDGETLQHYAMGRGRGKVVWNDDAAERAALAMGDLMGTNLRKAERAITPTQAAKILPKELFEAYAHRRSGELKLTRFDGNSVAKAFSKFTLESK